MPGGLGAANDQIAYVGVGDDVADNFFETNVLSLYGPGKRCSSFHAGSYKVLKFRGNLICVSIQDDGNSNWRKIIPPDIPAFFWWIIWMWIYFKHVWSPDQDVTVTV